MTSTDQPTTRTPVPPHGANAQPGPPPTRSFSTRSPQNGGVVGPNLDTGGTADEAGGTDSGGTTGSSTEEGSGT